MSYPKTILAAALKSKKLAVAIFCGERLIYYRSSGLSAKENGSDHLAAEKIENLIRVYKPDYLAVEKLVYKQQQIQPITEVGETATLKLANGVRTIVIMEIVY